jgi:Radical SAM superfamily
MTGVRSFAIMSGGLAKRRFQLILIKPSHYDDQGYVIQWFRSVMPSNSLAALYGLAVDARERQVLGTDVEIDVTPIDETNTRIKVKRIIAQLKRHGGFGLVGLVGVQSNQYPRAIDIARQLRAAGVQVVIGGFHVSGCLSMLDGIQPDLQIALDIGVSLFAGESEERLDGLLRDAAGGSLQPIYNFLNDLPAIESAPVPFLLREHVKRTAGNYSTFDAGRGCPYQCSFCTIINVQGRKSRSRSPDDVERIIRQNWAEGIHRFFITDDNLARNKEWEPILDRIIKLRTDEGIAVSLMIQVDTLCHKISNFVEKCANAGVTRVFIGLENINPDNLLGAKKRQNKITEYRKLLLAWKTKGIVTYAGYILGFPNDTPESIARDISIMQREHAAAGLRGSPDPLAQRGRYGPRHEQVRHRTRGHDSSENEQGGMGGHLSQGVGPVLHARASGAHHAPGGRDQGQAQLARGHAAAFLPVHQAGECASAAGGDLSAEIPARSPTRPADRAGVAVLSKIYLGHSGKVRGRGKGRTASLPPERHRQERS